MKKQDKEIITTVLISFIYIFMIAAFMAFQTEDGTSENGMIAEVNKQVKEGKLAVAIENYQKLARAYPRSYKVHLKLGDLYIDINDIQKAKIEYYRATKFSPRADFDAHFKLAGLYLDLKENDLAEDIIENINSKHSTKLLGQKGDFYQHLAKNFKNDQLEEALRTLKIAHRYHVLSNAKNINEDQELIAEYSIKLAKKLKAERHKNEAVNILEQSLKYYNSAKTHIKLADYLISRDNQKALKHIKKCLQIDTTNKYAEEEFNILVRLGNSYKRNKKDVQAKYAYMLAKKVEPTKSVPKNEYKDLLINVISTKFNEDFSGKNITPGISFRIMNISKEEIKYLKTKVVFFEGEKEFSETIKQLASKTDPIKGDEVTSQIVAFSPKSIKKGHLSDLEYRVQIFISKNEPDKWVLYRNSQITNY